MTQQNTSYQGNLFFLYLRSGLLFASVLAITIVISFVVLAIAPFPGILRYKVAAFWAKNVLFLGKTICGMDYRVMGLENIPKDQNAIILCKHQSAWETIYLMTILPTSCILLKQSLLWIPFWGWAMASLKPIAIDRSNPKQALSQLLKQGTQRLQEGFWLIIFPEGTRTTPGTQRKFSASGSLLAQRTGYPVIPIAHNAGELWPRNSFLKYPGVIQVKIGFAIDVHDRKSRDINSEAEAWIKHAMQEIDATKNSLLKSNS